MEKEDLLLKVENMYKSFGITKALKDVSISVRRGQVLGLIGENGSGKSTLTSIIAAIQKADSGNMYFEGEVYEPHDAADATKKGICMIMQEKGTFDMLSVANNIFVGREERFIRGGYLRKKEMIAAAQKALDEIQASYIDASVKLETLSFEDRKLVEVARAMQNDPKVLVVDETTTALSRNGRDVLYGIINTMKKQGKSVIFISHDLDEIMEVCDTLTVLRDGAFIRTLEKEEFEAGLLRRLMVGRDVLNNYYRADMESCKNKEVVFSMEHISYKEVQDVSFQLHKGEILGFGGLGDCGMHVLGNLAFGLSEPDLGKVCAADGSLITSPAQAMRGGIAYISKNRDQETLMVSSSIKDNVCIASYPKIRKGCFILGKDEEAFVDEWTQELEIKMQNTDQYVMELSGGNKQKVALAKWLGYGADIFIFDCPTRGIDIGVKANIYQLMNQLKEAGKSIVMISEELAEVIGMSDRVIILKEGKISGEFRREEELTETKLIEYMV